MLKKDEKVGDYILIEKVGSGGFGEVWKAEKRTQLSTITFAIKFFRAKDDEEIELETVKKEVQIWQKLSGLPHIISVIEGNQFEDYVYIVSEFADGGSLDKWLRHNGGKANSYQEAVSIISQILQGLEGMHSESFVHRDLKPANVLIKRNILFLADFGISRQMKTHSKTTGTAGTYDYMPPEAFESKPLVSVHTDIWAAGVLLQKLLSGSMPFPQKEIPSLLGAIMMREPEPLPEDVPPGLKEIVKKALQKKREDRFQSAREMNEALRDPQKFLETRAFSPIETIDDKELETETVVVDPTQDWRAIEAEKMRQSQLAEEQMLKETEETKETSTLTAKRQQAEINEIQPDLQKIVDKPRRSKIKPIIYAGAASVVIIILLLGGIFFYYLNSAPFSINLPKNLHNGIKDENLIKLINDKNICLLSVPIGPRQWFRGQEISTFEVANKLKQCSSSLYINADAKISFGEIFSDLYVAKEGGADETIIFASSTEANKADIKFKVKIPGQLDNFKNKEIPSDPFPLASVIELIDSGRFLLNNQPLYTLESLGKSLSDTFKNRAENGKYIEGTNKVESTVYIKAPSSATLDQVTQIINAVAGTKADPIILQVDYSNLFSKPTTTPSPTNQQILKNSIGMEFVKISAGSFMMGSDSITADEKPVSKVTISNDFYLGKYEVTQAQWKAIMGNLPTKCDRGSLAGNFVGNNKPISCVSWDDVQEFIKKLNANGETYRLPTEAEWEYAARGGTTNDTVGDLDSIAWYEKNSGGTTHEVGTKRANAWGLYDMQGNVWEWCQDWFGNYSGESVTDPTGATSGSKRVYRGGGYFAPPEFFRLAYRGSDAPSVRSSGIGFRLLRIK